VFANNTQKNEILLGILLGYGKENALFYDRLVKLSKFLGKTGPLTAGSSIDFQWQKLIKRSAPLSGNTFSPLWRVKPIQCAVNIKDPNKKILKKKYEVLRKKILEIYALNEYFLELVVTALCKKDNFNCIGNTISSPTP